MHSASAAALSSVHRGHVQRDEASIADGNVARSDGGGGCGDGTVGREGGEIAVDRLAAVFMFVLVARLGSKSDGPLAVGTMFCPDPPLVVVVDITAVLLLGGAAAGAPKGIAVAELMMGGTAGGMLGWRSSACV